ncbi:hypothetical protein F5X68DRAFT_210068, partial [Plectosphaerella plurivora]
ACAAMLPSPQVRANCLGSTTFFLARADALPSPPQQHHANARKLWMGALVISTIRPTLSLRPSIHPAVRPRRALRVISPASNHKVSPEPSAKMHTLTLHSPGQPDPSPARLLAESFCTSTETHIHLNRLSRPLNQTHSIPRDVNQASRQSCCDHTLALWNSP